MAGAGPKEDSTRNSPSIIATATTSAMDSNKDEKKSDAMLCGEGWDQEQPCPKETTENRSQKYRDRFGDCALVEIIHLHDCLRGAISDLQREVTELSKRITQPAPGTLSENDGESVDSVKELQQRVAARFKVIWSVFRAHSAAEDEFIWPALQSKQSSLKEDSHPLNENGRGDGIDDDAAGQPAVVIEQEEYEEDHADEERMFKTMNDLLSRLREGLLDPSSDISSELVGDPSRSITTTMRDYGSVKETVRQLDGTTKLLSKHLMAHLEKEEKHCMPLVAKHLTNSEIHDLVGQIMGKRSCELMTEILTMAIQNLEFEAREQMLRYMRQAMVGTFFERWLAMGGFMQNFSPPSSKEVQATQESSYPKIMEEAGRESVPNPTANKTAETSSATSVTIPEACDSSVSSNLSLAKATSILEQESQGLICGPCTPVASTSPIPKQPLQPDEIPTKATQVMEAAERIASKISSSEELEKLIRAIAVNRILSPVQKNSTIQKLRDIAWNARKRKLSEFDVGRRGRSRSGFVSSIPSPPFSSASATTIVPPLSLSDPSAQDPTVIAPSDTSSRMTMPPSCYYKKDANGKTELYWNGDATADSKSVPLFSAAELAPSYHDGARGTILGCPHYARSCKLRHPTSGRLYPCRLCCEQEKELPTKKKDSSLDRYAVTEVLCMRCGALQPASERCVNPECKSAGRPFAKYNCRICNLYDDRSNKSIYHCPFCNVCRTGFGLGIDYRHCMRCNACVSLNNDNHHCIPQRLQGNCPICHEAMFESTEPLKGLKCGHVMHMSCFGMYMRGSTYTCPLCKKSVEDMKEYFALLDAAVRMQPMPAAFSSAVTHIKCQDCGWAGNVSYHFVGCKCGKCGSYNTRQLHHSESVGSPR